MSSLWYIKPTFHQKRVLFLQLSSSGLFFFFCGVGDMFWMVPGLGVLAESLFPSMMRMESAAALEGKSQISSCCTPPPGNVSPDCSKVTPGTQILPSLVGAHNNCLPSPPLPVALPSCLSILFVYSAACLEQWLVHPHLLHSYPQAWHRQAAATVSLTPSPPPLDCFFFCVCVLNLLVIVDYSWFSGETINP